MNRRARRKKFRRAQRRAAARKLNADHAAVGTVPPPPHAQPITASLRKEVAFRSILTKHKAATESGVVTLLLNVPDDEPNPLPAQLQGLQRQLQLHRHTESFVRYERLLHHLVHAAPKLGADPYYLQAFWRACSLPWSRAMARFQPRCRGRDALFRAVVDHLWVRYTPPRFLYNVFLDPGEVSIDTQARLFLHIVQGGSVRRAIKTGLLPVPLTRRMCHLFMHSPKGSNLVCAVRCAQIQAMGGDVRLSRAVSRTRLGRQFLPDEPFWATVLQWMCNQTTLGPSQVAPLMDYIAQTKASRPDFAIQGRSPLALLRAMVRWHRELANTEQADGVVFSPSGFKGKVWAEQEFRDGASLQARGEPQTLWQITEIRSGIELLQEGRTMGHCVYSYAPVILKGTTSIWRLSRTTKHDAGPLEKPMLTIEVSNPKRAIVQARGRRNRLPSSQEHHLLRLWARESGLKLSYR